MSSAAEILQDLAVVRAAGKVLKERENELRRQADESLLDVNRAFGSKNADVRVMGVSVGTLSVQVSNPRFEVENEPVYQEFLKGLYANGDDRVRLVYEAPALWGCLAAVGGKDGIRVVDTGTGEVVPGVRYVPGGEVTGTRFTGCKVGDVEDALRVGGYTLAAALAFRIGNTLPLSPIPVEEVE